MSASINTNPAQPQQILGGQPTDTSSNIITQTAGTATNIAAKLEQSGFSLSGGGTNTIRNRAVYFKKVQSVVAQLASTAVACKRVAQQPGISPEAKAVYRRLGNI